jgi:antitoxin YefM
VSEVALPTASKFSRRGFGICADLYVSGLNIVRNVVQYFRGGDGMIAVNYSNAREHFKKYCEAAVRDFETIIVTRKHDENVVIMSEAEYNNLMENLYVRDSKEDYQRLLESIEQLKRGKGQIRALVEDE